MQQPQPTNLQDNPQLRDRRILIATGSVAIMLLLVGIIPNLISLQIISLNETLTNKLRLSINNSALINQLMVDQESGQRGYIAGKNPIFLEPYTAGRQRLAALWPQAEADALNVSAEVVPLLAEVKRAAATWQEQIGERTIQLVDSNASDEVINSTVLEPGKRLFDQFRARIAAFDLRINDLRTTLVSQREGWVLLLEVTLVVLIGLGLVAIATLYYIIKTSRRYLVEAVRQSEAARARDDLLSVARHELRTPITSIKGYTQMTLRRLKKLDKEAGERLGGHEWSKINSQVQTIDQQVGRLERLVEDLLDVNRVLSYEEGLQRTPTDLAQLAAQVVAQLQPLAPNHDLQVTGNAALIVPADAGRIEQVLSNLVSNAIKYSPNGGLVVINLRQTAKEAICTVSDKGLGIAPAEQKGLFQQFYRGSNVGAGATRISGFGLGLYISRNIIEQHGGSIWVESSLGRGSRFSFSLPPSEL